MSIINRGRTIAPTDALARVNEFIDLTNVRRKLADPEEGKGYNVVELDRMEAEYRRFLALELAYPDAAIVPCGIVDEMWHQHILDTRAYAADCEALFGEFLHHHPPTSGCATRSRRRSFTTPTPTRSTGTATRSASRPRTPGSPPTRRDASAERASR